MPNDQFGKPVLVGDTVTLVGEVTEVLDSPNFINCKVKLQQQMPPSGTEVSIEVNTVQLEKKGGAAEAKGGVHNPQPTHGAPAKK